MDINKLTINTRFKSNSGYWLYVGKDNYSDFYCDKCHKLKPTYEFLFYQSLEIMNTDDTGNFNSSAHFGSECVKEFLKTLTIID